MRVLDRKGRGRWTRRRAHWLIVHLRNCKPMSASYIALVHRYDDEPRHHGALIDTPAFDEAAGPDPRAARCSDEVRRRRPDATAIVQERPYHRGNAASRSICEAKHGRGQSVLRSGTTRESCAAVLFCPILLQAVGTAPTAAQSPRASRSLSAATRDASRRVAALRRFLRLSRGARCPRVPLSSPNHCAHALDRSPT